MKHDIKTILAKAFTGKHRNWAIVLTTLMALLITSGIVSSVQVRITAEQPSTYAQSPNGDRSASVPNDGSQSQEPDHHATKTPYSTKTPWPTKTPNSTKTPYSTKTPWPTKTPCISWKAFESNHSKPRSEPKTPCTRWAGTWA